MTMRWIASSIGAAACTIALASPYPSKPIRIIHPYAPGGGTETQARALAQFMSESWRQPVIIESRPGAGSAVGTQIVAKATPDGYSLLFTNAAFATAPNFHNLYHPVQDFAPIVQVGTQPLILVAHPSLPPTLREMIAHAKANPHKLNFASAGAGDATHLAVEYLESMAGIHLVHVPYKGSAPAIAAVLSGDVHLAMFSANSVVPHVRAGRLRALSVSSRKRSDLLPDVPTVSEMGVRGYEVVQWSGVLAPAGTPRAVVLELNRKINDALKAPDVKERLDRIDVAPAGGTPEEFSAFIHAELAKWRRVIREAGIKPE
jgi:tripartite-type tricarboxylate transporter receptor subunit TctC